MHDNLSGDIDLEEERLWAMVVHGLYLAGFLTGGMTLLVGVVIAYLRKDSASSWAYGHHVFAIRTFWTTLLAIAAIVTLLVAGMLSGSFPWFVIAVVPVVGIWFGLRAIVPLVKASQFAELADPETLWI